MVTKRKYIYLIILSLLFILSCSKKVNSNVINITKWEVLYSQTTDYSKANLSDKWEEFRFNNIIPLPYNKRGIHQYIWLKGDFYIEESTESFKGVSFKHIPPVHRVYINDVLITETTIKEIRHLGGPQNYYIPSNLLKVGNNTIHIRIGEFDNWDIEIDNNITIDDSVTYIKNRAINNLINEIIPMFVLSMLVVSFVAFLLKGLIDKGNKEYLILSFRLLLILLCFFTFYSPVAIFSINIIEALWSGIIPLFCICIILQAQVTFSIFFNKLNRLIISTLIILSTSIFTLKVISFNHIFYVSLLLLSILISFIYLAFITIKIIKNRSRDFKLILIIVDALVILINIFSIFTFLAFRVYILDPSIVVIISCIILTVLYTIYFAKRDSLRNHKMSSLKTELKKLESKSRESKKYNISPQIAEKLDNIILFIKENHSQSVTRELLAETAEVSPNYLSSLFNIYTGKKINEFINDIRLDDAAVKLTDSDLSITDIAFSSGFESITTFNRLFKKKFGKSPKLYREKQ